jgi:hypothetical protein
VPGVGGVQEAFKYAASGINPLFRVPFEIAAGREVYTSREIGEGGDLTVGRHVANQVRPLREIPKLLDVADERGAAAGVARGLLGGRAVLMDDDRMRAARRSEFRREEERLRQGLYRAQREENRATSIMRRAQLLKLYEAMMDAGFGEDVPAGMRGQVERLRAEAN